MNTEQPQASESKTPPHPLTPSPPVPELVEGLPLSPSPPVPELVEGLPLSPLIWAELARAHSAAGAGLAVWIGGRVAGAGWEMWWWLPMGVAFLLSAAGNAFNDAHDAAIDAINRPQRPIPRGAVTPAQARRFAYGCAGVAFLLALPFGLISTLGTLAGIALLFLYTTHFKSIPLLGNSVVGLLTGMALAYGGLLGGDVPAIFLPAATLGLLFGGREVLKTIHDIPGDHANGLRTIATVAGVRIALLAATLCFLVALILLIAWSLLLHHPRSALTFWHLTSLDRLSALIALASAFILIPLWLAPQDERVVRWALRWSKGLGLLLLLGLSLI